jgi:membrane protease YdiL (CAAX protease family)
MLTSTLPVEKSSTFTLLKATARDLAIALLIGATIWVPLLLALQGRVWPADRWSLLIIVVGNQVGFLLVGLRQYPGPMDAACGVRTALGAGVLVAFALILLGIFYDAILRWKFGAGTPTIGPWGAIRSLGPAAAVLMLVLGIASGPAAEEWFFRGDLFRRWADAGRPWGGATLSALLYATAALDAWNAPAYLVMGLVLAWIHVRTGSLVAPSTAHTIVNGAMLALLFSGYE